MSKPGTILIVSQYYPPDVTAAAFRISETADVLKEHGFRVKILTAEPHKSKVKSDFITSGQEVIRVPIAKLRNRGTRGYLLHYLSFMINSFLKGILKIGKIDYVMASSPPLFVALSGWLLSCFKRAKFILDIRDIWPDSAVGTGHLQEASLIYKIGKISERFVYCQADLITCVSERMKDYIKGYFKGSETVLVLYNGLSEKFFDNCQINSKNNILPKNEFLISYLGNLGYAQNLDLIIEASQSLRGRGLKFVLIGEGSVKEELLERTRSMGLDNIIFRDGCSKEKAFEYMYHSQALLIILNKESNAFNRTIPSKVFDYLWANRPILYGIEGEGREILGSLRGNLYFDASKHESLAKAVVDLQDNYDSYRMEAQGNRELVLNNFIREKIVKKLVNHLIGNNL